jgi:glycosyltransferase involved in cell wall biosynthesis
MFSLCIPTMNRFDTFLKKNLERYLQNDLIREIIIADETGADAAKIRAAFNDPRIKVYVNERRLGPFLNKHGVCKKATSEWIILMDSDNFAPAEYFTTVKNYIAKNAPAKESILAPTWAQPQFDYRHLSGHIMQRSTFHTIRAIEARVKPQHNIDCIINTGNYVINKHLIDNLDLSKETDIQLFTPSDVVYMNTLFFEQFNMQFHMVPGLFYEHVVHDGSTYMQLHRQFQDFEQKIYRRFKAIYNL